MAQLWSVAHVRITRSGHRRIASRDQSYLPAQRASQVDLNSRTIPIRVELTNPEGLLRPGMSATASVPLGTEAGVILAVPSAALQRLQEGWAVFLPRAQDRFEIRSVGRGRDLGGEVEVVSGLQAGETIVVEGAFLLKAEAEKSSGEGEHHEH